MLLFLYCFQMETIIIQNHPVIFEGGYMQKISKVAKNYKAFTLAEVLITLGIIGVVAAMTIPTLIANYQKKVLTTQLQRTYALLANASKMLMAEEQVDLLDKTYLTDDPEKFLKAHFKIVQDCTDDANVDKCFAKYYKDFEGEVSRFGPETAGDCVGLSNGTSLCVGRMQKYDREAPEYHAHSYVTVDVNGLAGPNQAGRDFFSFYLYSDGIIGESYNSTREDLCSDNLSVASAMYGAPGCFDKIKHSNWKMDY